MGLLRPAGKGADPELPARRGLLIGYDPQVGQRSKHREKLLMASLVGRSLGDVGHGPEANGAVPSGRREPSAIGRERDRAHDRTAVQSRRSKSGTFRGAGFQS